MSGADVVRAACDVDRVCGAAAGGGATTAVSALLRVIGRMGLPGNALSDSEPDVTPPAAAVADDVSACVEVLDAPLRNPTDGNHPPVLPGVELRCIEEASCVVRRTFAEGGSTGVTGEFPRTILPSPGWLCDLVTGGKVTGLFSAPVDECE